MHHFLASLKVGWFLGIRQLRRARLGTSVLIITIMTLTFLNLVAVSGILVGLIEGGSQANTKQYTGELFIRELPDEDVIQQTQTLIRAVRSFPSVSVVSARFVTGASIEANYQTRRDFQGLPNKVSTSLVGLNVRDEQQVTHIDEYVVEGQFLDPKESGYIVLGSTLLSQYSAFSDLFEPLRDVQIGDRVKISVQGLQSGISFDRLSATTTSGNVQEFIVKGIVKSKVDEVSVRAFITEGDFRRLTGQTDLNAKEVAVMLAPGASATSLKNKLVDLGFDRWARIQTAQEAIPRFLNNIKITFAILGNVIGSIGLVVASITIFIVIYINAVTRRKFIGILKAIGMSRMSICIAYVLQALAYGAIGSAIGLLLVYGVLVPQFAVHPLDFPFSDGILVAPLIGTIVKLIVLFIVTTIAGFLPAWLIVRQNTLDSILGR